MPVTTQKQTITTIGSLGAADILKERRRQVEVEGFTRIGDKNHLRGQLANASSCYAHHAALPDHLRKAFTFQHVPLEWPWAAEWWKPKTRRHDLVKAGALIIAEIDRLDAESGDFSTLEQEQEPEFATIPEFDIIDDRLWELVPKDAVIARVRELERRNQTLTDVLQPLISIANAYDNNELDDEARKTWGNDNERENRTPHAEVELYAGRGGNRLLTLYDCMVARRVVEEKL